ncbi:MAG: class I SAM-dependent methyltransferase [Pseudomonadota bacterium]|nr:class I SAM-dependent methyltransferase [Pseudomonadota bacterium]
MNQNLTKRIVKNFLSKIPYCNKIIRERGHWVPAGHFYSPIPDLQEIKAKEQAIFETIPRTLAGIDLNEEEQLTLLETFKPFNSEMPFKDEPQTGLRYYFKARAFGYEGAIGLYSMMRYLKPKRIIEVGSGKSSAVMLDTNDLFFNSSIAFTFIEPYPKVLFSMVKQSDIERNQLLTQKLQDVNLDVFSQLSANDILFIDSTHVSKINSDVNYLFFEILPSLASGVYIHIHDIFYPFEYPKHWLYKKGIAFNENYILRAFLQYNTAFKIVFFSSFLKYFYVDQLKQLMPFIMEHNAGSIWLRKC